MINKQRFETGIHDIGIDDYHNSQGWSRSQLLKLTRSPYHFWAEFLNPVRSPDKEQREALIYGNALHTYVLERHLFDRDYFIMPAIKRTTKAGKAQYARILEENEGKLMVKQAWLNDFVSIALSLEKNPDALALLTGGKIEQSLFWTDEQTGLNLKCRPDVWHSNMIVDLKSTYNAAPYAFRASMNDYGYHIQAAMIQDGILQVTGELIEDFAFVCAEKSYPFATAVHILHIDALEEGRRLYRGLLETLKRWTDEDLWPQYAPSVINLPAYAFKKEVEHE